MSDHERFQSNLAALAAGRLRGEELGELEAHLADCADCSEILELTREVAQLTPHPEVLELQGYAEGHTGVAHAAVAAHVRRCASCTLEVEAWRRRRARPRRWVAPAAGAAGLLAASLALWFWLGPREHGPAQELMFTGALRGSPSQSVRQLDPLRSVILRAEWVPLEAFDEVGPLDFAIAPPGKRPIWSERLDAARVAEILRAGQGFSAVVPAGTLVPGEYAFTLSRTLRADEPPVVEGRFFVRAPAQRQSPAPTNAPQ